MRFETIRVGERTTRRTYDGVDDFRSYARGLARKGDSLSSIVFDVSRNVYRVYFGDCCDIQFSTHCARGCELLYDMREFSASDCFGRVPSSTIKAGLC